MSDPLVVDQGGGSGGNSFTGVVTGNKTLYTVGTRRYELTNHLGNVMSVITDRVTPIPPSSGSGVPDYYDPVVVSAEDYYPFGMQNRAYNNTTFTNDKYRYGFNGKEDDDEWGKQDYGMRIYDTRVARFLSVDPIAAQYPELTPYQFASNTPIMAIDLDGLEAKLNITKSWDGNTIQQIVLDVDIVNNSECSYTKACLESSFASIQRLVEFDLSSRDSYKKGGYEFKFGKIRFHESNESVPKNATFLIKYQDLPGESSMGEVIEKVEGHTEKLGDSQNNTILIDFEHFANTEDGVGFARVLAHEIAHSLGVRHALDEVNVDTKDPESNWSIKESPENLMRSGANELDQLGTELLPQQFETMVKQVQTDTEKDGKKN